MSVLIACAMPEEAAPFTEPAGTPAAQIRVVVTGIGMVNAAANVTAELERTKLSGEQFTAVLSVGSAGGLDTAARIGEVIVGTRYRYHDADATAAGYRYGQIPGMPEFFEADGELLSLARQVAADNSAENSSETGPSDNAWVRFGEIVSGNSFITATNATRVRERFPDALATEMEAVAIAQVCAARDIPFLSLRAVSDLCSADSAQVFDRNLDLASAQAARIATEVATRIG